MPKAAKALGALEVGRLANAKGAGYHAVGTVPGLYLQVTPGGAQSWVLRVKVGDKRREIGLGPYPAVRLAQAHQKAIEARESIQQGVDPLAAKRALKSAMLAQQAQDMTFDEAVRRYITAHRVGWQNAKHGQQWANTLATYAGPVMGKLNVRDVDLSHVLAVLEPIWTTKNETASRVRNRIESVLDWARVRLKLKGENPARWRGNLDKLLPKPSTVHTPKERPAVMVGEVGAFLRDLRQREGVGALALEFVLLTATRSGEALGATWEEIDLTAGVWVIPARRMKKRREHRVPLSGAALALLGRLPRMAGSELVFASPRGGGRMAGGTVAQLMGRMGYMDAQGRVCVPHGLRSTFRDWAGERTAYQSEVVEAALSHVTGSKTERAYFRSDLFDKRRRLMEDWAAFVECVEVPADNVVPLRGAA